MDNRDSGRSTQLAAIVFTDIVGYSRLMEEDEERTIDLLRQHNEIVLPLVEQHGGEVVDAIGDGLFLLFPTLRDAVVCSVTIQQAIAAYCERVPQAERFRLRIGVHLGEIWRDGSRVYGNGVNIAARVQPHAAPGGVCLTEDVYRQVSNKLSYEIRSIGRRTLRNISREVELYQVVTGHEADETQTREGGELDAIKQRILAEREKIATRNRQSGGTEPGSSLEQRVESKVYSLVERVMDAAVTKWDELPAEKKDRMISRLQQEIEKGKGEIHVGLRRGVDDDEDDDDHRSGRSVVSRLAMGVVFGVAFGLGHFLFGVSWMIWPFVLLGVLPFSSGLLRAVKATARNRREQRDRPLELERTMLAVARRLGGTVTVVQAASAANLSLDEVQQTLDRLTAKGYVAQHVQDSGIVSYEFPSLGSE